MLSVCVGKGLLQHFTGKSKHRERKGRGDASLSILTVSVPLVTRKEAEVQYTGISNLLAGGGECKDNGFDQATYKSRVRRELQCTVLL